jgi:hypothetical protein
MPVGRTAVVLRRRRCCCGGGVVAAAVILGCVSIKLMGGDVMGLMGDGGD